MTVFSKKNKTKREYSGYEEASLGLRNRLLSLYGWPYSGNEHSFGIGNTNWIHEHAFDKDFQMHFGRKMTIEQFRNENETTYDDVFDYIELYFRRALQDLDHNTIKKLYLAIKESFDNAGSVYEFSKEGHVALRVEDETIEKVDASVEILEPFEDAKNKFINASSGLVNRKIDPADAIGDIFIVLEDYFKSVTGKNTFEKAVKHLEDSLDLHPIQLKIIEKIKAYRGDVWGSAHAGNSPKPLKPDALWYLETTMDLIRYIDSKLKDSNKKNVD